MPSMPVPCREWDGHGPSKAALIPTHDLKILVLPVMQANTRYHFYLLLIIITFHIYYTTKVQNVPMYTYSIPPVLRSFWDVTLVCRVEGKLRGNRARCV